MKGYVKKDQVFCYECGARFVPDGPFNELGVVATHCPGGCNRGSWIERERTSEDEIEIDL